MLLLDEPDNYLDVPAKQWLEERLAATSKAVLLVSHDRELLSRAASRIVTLEPGAAGAVSWVHGGSFATYHAARDDRNSRLEELRRRWDEERAKLKALVLMYKTKAAFNDGLASRYQAAQTRLAKFEAAGPPQAVPLTQKVTMRLAGGRTAKRAVVCTAAGADRTDGAVRPRGLLRRPGRGAGLQRVRASRISCGCWRAAAPIPTSSTSRCPTRSSTRCRTPARWCWDHGCGPGFFRQTHAHSELNGRTLLEILHRG